MTNCQIHGLSLMCELRFDFVDELTKYPPDKKVSKNESPCYWYLS
jgi:hypothetical protein